MSIPHENPYLAAVIRRASRKLVRELKAQTPLKVRIANRVHRLVDRVFGEDIRITNLQARLAASSTAGLSNQLGRTGSATWQPGPLDVFDKFCIEHKARRLDAKIAQGVAIELDHTAVDPSQLADFVDQNKGCNVSFVGRNNTGRIILVCPDAETASLARLSL